MGFLDENSETKASETPDDKRTRAVLRYSQKRRQDRFEAIRIMESIGQLQPLTVNDQFVLAQMYDSVGDLAKVRSLMQDVLNKQDDIPQYLAFYIRFLLAQKDPLNAKRWVDRLSDLQPKAGQTYELKARLLHAQEKTAEAVALLTAYAEEKDAPLLGIARLLEQLEDAQKNTAKRMYERLVDKADKDRKPDALLALAGFLGRNGHLKESLDIYSEQLRNEPHPERIIGTALFILYQTNSGTEDWKRVEGWLQEALPKAKEGQRAALQKQLATLYNLQSRFDDSETTYRLSLKENPRDTLSMNNLAWLLATKGQKADEALTHIQRAIDLDGPLPGLLDTRAIVYLAQGKSESAVKELEDIVIDNPTGTSYFHMAQAYHAAKNKPAAREALQKALKTYNLKEKELHPFEREKYQQLQAELGVKGDPGK
jgi:cellulose synthase operon protein C